MRIFIEPSESLMFRTGRPFNAGESTFAESLFPPTPETLQGALRAAIATQWGLAQEEPIHHLAAIFGKANLVELIGDRSSYGRFRITGFTLGRRREDERIERLFPAPAHIISVNINEQKEPTFLFMRPEENKDKNIHSNLPEGISYSLYPKRLVEMSEKASALNGWLTPKGLQAVLADDQLSRDHFVTAESIYSFESRLGIGMENSSKTTRESYLYQSRFIRMMPHYGFVVDIAIGNSANSNRDHPIEENLETQEAFSFLQDGWLTLGGEQRAARFFVLKDEKECAQEPDLQTSGDRQLLYFATPAFFKKGWLPADGSLLPSSLVTAAINKYQTIGGWSLEPGNAGGSPKTTHRCVPAGSVYFFDRQIDIRHPITEYGWQIGYGITYTGVWK